MREALKSSVLNKKRNTYRIKTYKDVKVNLITLDDPSIITLLNIAYVPNYLINIVTIKRFSRKNIYWLNITPNILIYGKEVFANLEVVRQYYIL